MAKFASDERIPLVLTRFEAQALAVVMDEVLGFREVAEAVFDGNGGRRALSAAERARGQLRTRLGKPSQEGAE